MSSRSYRAPSETEIAIAKLIDGKIPDGAELSLGVGGVPFTVAFASSDPPDPPEGFSFGFSNIHLVVWAAFSFGDDGKGSERKAEKTDVKRGRRLL